MKRTVIALGLASLSLCGCQSKSASGALAGGAIGAGTGALIGGGEGALIGGAVGVISGGLIGAALDEQDRRILEAESPSTLNRIERGDQLTLYDVKEMTRAGITEDVIISQIEQTGSRFYLSTNDIIDLKNSGVSQRVINYMIQTGS